MVKPKEIKEIKLEDYFYIDEKGVLRWKQRYSKMNKGDRAGKVYSRYREEVCFKGHYYPVNFIKDLLIKSGMNCIPEKLSNKKVADSAPVRLLTTWADPKKTYMSSTEDLSGLVTADRDKGQAIRGYPRNPSSVSLDKLAKEPWK